MKIEKARECEVDAMLDIRTSAILHDAGSAFSESDVEKWAVKRDPTSLRRHIQDGEVWVARQSGDQIAGWAWRNGARVKQIYVASQCQRQGVGRRLLAFLENQMRDEGLHQTSANAALNAVAFYQSCGYVAGPGEQHETTQTMRRVLAQQDECTPSSLTLSSANDSRRSLKK